MGFLSAAARPTRRLLDEKGLPFGITDLFGQLGRHEPGPQSFLVTVPAGAVVRTHFHDVDQYQLFLSGRGRFGRYGTAHGFLQYADAYTPYGPIRAPDEPVEYLTIRPTADSGAQYMPESRPRRRRLGGRQFATRLPRIEHGRRELFGPQSDGLGASIVRVEPGEQLDLSWAEPATHPQAVVMAGELQAGAAVVAPFAVAAVEQGPPDVCAGAAGATVAVLRFPRMASHEQPGR